LQSATKELALTVGIVS